MFSRLDSYSTISLTIPLGDQLPFGAYRVLKCDVIILQTFPFKLFKPHHAIDTAAVRTWAKFQIASINESEDREL